jgi:hypothetical protein
LRTEGSTTIEPERDQNLTSNGKVLIESTQLRLKIASTTAGDDGETKRHGEMKGHVQNSTKGRVSPKDGLTSGAQQEPREGDLE